MDTRHSKRADLGWHTDSDRVRWHVMQHDSIRTNLRASPDPDWPKNAGARANLYVVFNHRNFDVA